MIYITTAILVMLGQKVLGLGDGWWVLFWVLIVLEIVFGVLGLVSKARE